MNKNITIIIIAIIVIGAGSFYGGMSYAQSKTGTGNQNGFANLSPQERQARLAQRGTTGTTTGGSRNGGGFTTGEIISKDANGITIKLQDGGSKIIFLTSTTPVMKSVEGSSKDLSIGQTVAVTGTTNPDGSVSAQSIQLRPVAMK